METVVHHAASPLSFAAMFANLNDIVERYAEQTAAERKSAIEKNPERAKLVCAADARVADVLAFIKAEGRTTRADIMEKFNFNKRVGGEAVRILLAERKIAIVATIGQKKRQILEAR